MKGSRDSRIEASSKNNKNKHSREVSKQKKKLQREEDSTAKAEEAEEKVLKSKTAKRTLLGSRDSLSFLAVMPLILAALFLVCCCVLSWESEFEGGIDFLSSSYSSGSLVGVIYVLVSFLYPVTPLLLFGCETPETHLFLCRHFQLPLPDSILLSVLTTTVCVLSSRLHTIFASVSSVVSFKGLWFSLKKCNIFSAVTEQRRARRRIPHKKERRR